MLIKTTAALILLSALALAGCNRQPEPPQGAAPPAGARTQGIKIAMIAKSSTNPVFLSARTGAEAAAKELSAKHNVPIEIVWLTPPAEDGQVQAQRLAQAVNEGATAALISCSDAGKVTGAINDAVARGVPVMTFDSDVPQSKRFAFYGADDLKVGAETMAELAQQLGAKGKVAILCGNQNAPNLQKRVKGASDEAAAAFRRNHCSTMISFRAHVATRPGQAGAGRGRDCLKVHGYRGRRCSAWPVPGAVLPERPATRVAAGPRSPVRPA